MCKLKSTSVASGALKRHRSLSHDTIIDIHSRTTPTSHLSRHHAHITCHGRVTLSTVAPRRASLSLSLARSSTTTAKLPSLLCCVPRDHLSQSVWLPLAGPYTHKKTNLSSTPLHHHHHLLLAHTTLYTRPIVPPPPPPRSSSSLSQHSLTHSSSFARVRAP